jgi:hypothetical protein
LVFIICLVNPELRVKIKMESQICTISSLIINIIVLTAAAGLRKTFPRALDYYMHISRF